MQQEILNNAYAVVQSSTDVSALADLFHHCTLTDLTSKKTQNIAVSKQSITWRYFDLDEGGDRVKCKLCLVEIEYLKKHSFSASSFEMETPDSVYLHLTHCRKPSTYISDNITNPVAKLEPRGTIFQVCQPYSLSGKLNQDCVSVIKHNLSSTTYVVLTAACWTSLTSNQCSNLL